MYTALDQIGESDCESLGSGLLAQPANAWSSLAYVVVGLVVVMRALRQPRGSRVDQAVFGIVLISVGVGSFLYHGPQPDAARLVHDLSIASVVVFIVTFDLAVIRRWARAKALAAFSGLIVVLGTIMAISPNFAITATIPLVGAAVLTEVVVYRRGLRGTGVAKRVVQVYVGIAALVAVAAVLNVLGRSDGPLCDPDGELQFHAVWHALTAVAFGMWALIGFPSGGEALAEERARESTQS